MFGKMMISRTSLPVVTAAVLWAGGATLFVGVSGQAQWCGKNYESTLPIVPPGGQFSTPPPSSSPLIAFRCSQAIRPYLEGERDGGVIIDTDIVMAHVVGAEPIELPSRHIPRQSKITGKAKATKTKTRGVNTGTDAGLAKMVVNDEGGKLGTLDVTVKVNGRTITSGQVPLNVSAHLLPFSLSHLVPQTRPYQLECQASYPSFPSSASSATSPQVQTFSAIGSLAYLPLPTDGDRSITKMDLKTGALLTRPVSSSSSSGGDREVGEYETIFPIGFYTNFGGYLDSDLSILDTIKADGFNIIHPIPTFDNLTTLSLILDRMEELGLYLMYDMRWTYLDTNTVTEEVNRIKNRPNVLLWYTADEPDGWVDPHNGTSIAYKTINELDGYRPVSLVLNCENYFFEEYAAGADVLLQDVYMIGNNVTFSSQWHTPCTPDYGDCGCDNCKGAFEDISNRMDEYFQRMYALGWNRGKTVWTVPQAFGEDTYWKRNPTGEEWAVQASLAIIHGATGVISWNDPTTSSIKSTSSSFAIAIKKMKDVMLSSEATFWRGVVKRVEVGVWKVVVTKKGEKKKTKVVVLATNLNYEQVDVELSELVGGTKVLKGLLLGNMEQVFDSGVKMVDGTTMVSFGSVGTGAFVFSS